MTQPAGNSDLEQGRSEIGGLLAAAADDRRGLEGLLASGNEDLRDWADARAMRFALAEVDRLPLAERWEELRLVWRAHQEPYALHHFEARARALGLAGLTGFGDDAEVLEEALIDPRVEPSVRLALLGGLIDGRDPDAMHLLGYDGVVGSRTLAADAVSTVWPDLGGRVLAGAVAVSAFGVLNAGLLTAPRLIHGMAADGTDFAEVLDVAISRDHNRDVVAGRSNGLRQPGQHLSEPAGSSVWRALCRGHEHLHARCLPIITIVNKPIASPQRMSRGRRMTTRPTAAAPQRTRRGRRSSAGAPNQIAPRMIAARNAS